MESNVNSIVNDILRIVIDPHNSISLSLSLFLPIHFYFSFFSSSRKKPFYLMQTSLTTTVA